MNYSFFSSPTWGQQISQNYRFLVRIADSKDLTQLADILALSFHSREGFVDWVYPVLRLGIYEDLKNRLRFKTEYYICLVSELVSREENSLAKQPESIAGTVEVALRSRLAWQLPSSDYPYLSNLAVHPEYRRQGVAQQLLSSCEQTVREWGFSEVYLHVLENNHGARQLYYQTGYRLEQVEWDWSCWLLGQPRRLFLRKKLAS
ncbi:MAG: GNAT family N-acetyltransferase [Tychonema bourrellyi B0820]|uniref:N-acetyltransferase n=1 Tax=Tychonema bourrellyi FEM_GT703 TaxID=2040638 RepID=A0A2G4EYA9_9CYAN|nr:GNAT family N-acetyltransferase [Tychonema bourrellyi]MDQ2096399.1 GNAT family N-acetyltransferase [Tychonema bourrellyi B0820]PHX54525.1 N-acetyltransferase [Tychonema bourrellyi FEM_GT703]